MHWTGKFWFEKKLVVIDLPDTSFYGSPGYKNRVTRKFTFQKKCFNKQNYSGHAEYFLAGGGDSPPLIGDKSPKKSISFDALPIAIVEN